MPGEKPSDKLIRRFFDIDSSDSKLSYGSVIANDSDKPSANLNSLTRNIASGTREDDGMSGERRALIFQSFSFKGIHNIPDPKIAGIITMAQGDIRRETRDLESIDVVLHYGVAEGGTLSMLDPEMVPFTMLSRFYEVFDQVGGSQSNTYRGGQVARVKFKGDNFGFIESFVDDDKSSSASNRSKPSSAAVGASSAFPPPHTPGSNGAGQAGAAAVNGVGGIGGLAGMDASANGFGAGGFGRRGAGSSGGQVQRLGNFPSSAQADADDGVYPGADMTYYGKVARRTKKPPRFSYDMIVLHDGGYGWRSGQSAVASFAAESLSNGLGSHYYITKEGKVYALTPEAYSVSHAAGDNDSPWNPNSVNMRSIGIDLQAAMDTRNNNKYGGEGIYTNSQYSALSSLISDLCSRRGIPMDNNHIIHHYSVQRNRVDLRYNFDFNRLGLGITNPLGNDDPQRLVTKDVKDQYPSDEYDFVPVGDKFRPFININKTKR